jgi:hypothetical protein
VGDPTVDVAFVRVEGGEPSIKVPDGYIEPEHLVFKEPIAFCGKSSGRVAGQIGGIMSSHIVRINGQPTTCRNSLVIDPVYVGQRIAARGMGGGGFHGGGMGRSGFRGAAIGGGFRGAQASVGGFNGGNNFAGRGGGRFAGGGYRHRHGRGLGFVGGLAVGSALGYGYGGYYGDDYYADNSYSDGNYDSGPSYVVSGGQNGDSGYCAQRYKSYDPASGTYLGYDGLRHPCE